MRFRELLAKVNDLPIGRTPGEIAVPAPGLSNDTRSSFVMPHAARLTIGLRF